MSILEKLNSVSSRKAEGKDISEKEATEILDHFCVVTEEEAAAGKRKPEFTDPKIAKELNDIYRGTRGYDHENFINNELGVINGMLEDQKGSKEELQELREIGAEIAEKGLLRPDENNVPVPVNIKEENLLEPIRFDRMREANTKKADEGR